VSRIRAPELLAEIGRRGLTRALADQYLTQMYGFIAFKNDRGGFSTYRRDGFRDVYNTVGPTSIRTIPADPKAESVTICVFAHFWDFLTHRHLRGPVRSDELHIIGEMQPAALQARQETRAAKVILFAPDVVAEQEFIDHLDSPDLPVYCGEQHLSDAFIANPNTLRQSMQSPEQRPDITQAASVTMRPTI
jgi:hypothetical protein